MWRTRINGYASLVAAAFSLPVLHLLWWPVGRDGALCSLCLSLSHRELVADIASPSKSQGGRGSSLGEVCSPRLEGRGSTVGLQPDGDSLRPSRSFPEMASRDKGTREGV